MTGMEITVGWEALANVIIKSLSDTALEGLNAGIKDGVKEVVKEGFADIAKDATGGVLRGGLAPVAMALILGQMLAVQRQQTNLLKSIQRDVKGLVEGPYYAGMTHLEDAMKKQRTPEQRLSLITKAREKFVDARGNQQNLDSFYRAIVEREIGICWLMCGSWIDAKDWFERSLASANQALTDEDGSAFKEHVGQYAVELPASFAIGAAAAALIAGPAGLIVVPALGAAGAINHKRVVDKHEKKKELIRTFKSNMLRILDGFNSDAYRAKYYLR